MALAVKNVRHFLAAFAPAARATRAADRAFDRRWGTDTSGGVSVHELGFDKSRIEHCRRYDPSSEAMLRDPIKVLALDPAECDFIDYGAGKGRVMMLAMEMGFRSVVGIELSARLCSVALMNIARFTARNQDMAPATVLQADATEFTPEGNHIVAYFYNPFGAPIMEEVRCKLEGALRQGTARVTVIYVNSEHHYVFGDAPGWTRGPTLKGIATFVADAAAF